MMLTSFDDFSFLKILSFLKAHESEFLSGQDMSDILKISRVAVWKDIKKIRLLGYKIESKQNLGYRLVDSSELLLPWEITQNLNTKFLGKRVYYFDSTDSTQNFAMEIASNDKENGTVVISKKQTGGRGRMKRKWKSPTGGIWMSIIIHPKFDVSYTTLVPIATSLALCMAIEKILKIKPELKWPNDVTLKGKKVAGVLVDTSIISNEIENMVLGIGINFKIKPHELASTIKKTPNFYGVATLVKKNERALPLVHQFLYELENVFQLINSRRIRKIKNEWTKRSSTIGRNVSIITSEGNVNGKAVKIDSDGALIISNGKKAERILVGDITQ
ncbi:biotin--[acetyl-CoA-carboxylase] ligase [Marine Group I thaumarchaeote]|jgi:BirA family biotin operon repressor/biotin-[acetyl-CoA-carboxylase] ligase|uniref:Biotin--[acetyl-CoA-carboxylase] ligase n=1 Tax=Marine Group I thaumarchaeote TaxID=2511932 RepID=A0A7K4NK99_9ARCH|nr:biotin--[acetyl-CoA-carboxylase] ligase [Marine Group I thaumarchaeote]